MTTRRETSLAVVATVGAAVLWGTSFSNNDLGLAAVAPVTFVVFRFAIAGALVLGVVAALRRFSTAPLRSAFFWILSAVNALGFILQYEGQALTTPARTALLVNTSAFTVALIERFVLGRPLGLGRWLAIGGGIVGLVVLVTGGDAATLSGGQLVGDLFVAGSGLLWAVYFVMNARAAQKQDPLLVTGWTFALSALLAAPFLFFDDAPLVVESAFGWWTVLYAGVVTTALAYGLWTFGLRHLRPSASAVLILVEILVASLVSIALGRETFGVAEVVGASILVASVVWMSVLEERASSAAS